MRLRTGAIFRDTRPETIITSACRGLARNTSEPKRARSFRDEVAFIISIAQHASPNVAGQSDDFRAQLISESNRVVKTSGKASAMMFSRPIKLLSGGRASGSSASHFHISQQSGFGLGFHSGSVAPLERPFFQNIQVAREQQYHKDHHLAVNEISGGRAQGYKRSEDDCPGNQKNDLYIE